MTTLLEHRSVRRELRSMLRLAVPVILAELGWITMGIVDTVIVQPLGPAAIGAVGTGSTMFMTLMVLGMGTLLSLDTFVSQNFGAGRMDECYRWLSAGSQLAIVLSVALILIGWAGVALLPRAHLHPEVILILKPYLARLLWSVPPLLFYTVFRRYLQAMNAVRPVMVALISANVINAVANWMLVFGHGGVPALGVVGSAYATLAARVYMALFLLVVILMKERARPSGLRAVPLVLESQRMWSLVRLGAPAAGQITLEVGVFATAAALAARITPLALAGNQIVLNIASFFFMVPLGLSSAAAVRVGQAVGRGNARDVRLAGWVALGLSVAFAACVSTAFLTTPMVFLRIFTDDPTLLRVGLSLLFICAAFQPFDSLQAVSTGALRGLGDTRTPMLLNLAGHWGVGLPLAYFLCFDRNWGVAGLWAGLAFGIALIGVVLVAVWHARARAFPASSVLKE